MRIKIIGGVIAALAIIFYLYKCQISAYLNLDLCPDVSSSVMDGPVIPPL
jgi:hypothetical protein